jgi:hypothetical protein
MTVSFVPKSSLNTTQQREQEEFALTKKMKKILDFYLIVSFRIYGSSGLSGGMKIA